MLVMMGTIVAVAIVMATVLCMVMMSMMRIVEMVG